MTGYNYGLAGNGAGFGEGEGFGFGYGDVDGDGCGASFGFCFIEGDYIDDSDDYGDGIYFNGNGDGAGYGFDGSGYHSIAELMIIAMYLALDRRLKTFNQERKDTHEHDN